VPFRRKLCVGFTRGCRTCAPDHQLARSGGRHAKCLNEDIRRHAKRFPHARSSNGVGFGLGGSFRVCDVRCACRPQPIPAVTNRQTAKSVAPPLRRRELEIALPRAKLPKGEFGYQVLSPTMLFEIAATAGPVLAGRYNVDDAPARPLGGLLQVGGHAAFGMRYLHLELAVKRFDLSDYELDPFSEFAGSPCGLPSAFTVCANVRHLAGGANAPAPDMRIAHLGIHVGVITSGDPGRRKNRNGVRTRSYVAPTSGYFDSPDAQ
jgi:hypothetical protein